MSCKCWDCMYLGTCKRASKTVLQCDMFDKYNYKSEELTDAKIASEISASLRNFERVKNKLTHFMNQYYQKTGKMLVLYYDENSFCYRFTEDEFFKEER